MCSHFQRNKTFQCLERNRTCVLLFISRPTNEWYRKWYHTSSHRIDLLWFITFLFLIIRIVLLPLVRQQFYLLFWLFYYAVIVVYFNELQLINHSGFVSLVSGECVQVILVEAVLKVFKKISGLENEFENNFVFWF